MNIQVKDIENLPARSKVTLLQSMISNAFLWWYQDTMRELDIAGRTRLYKAFSWSSWQYRENEPMSSVDPREEAATRILEQSTISTWTDRYLKHFTLAQFNRLYKEALPKEVDFIDVRVDMTT